MAEAVFRRLEGSNIRALPIRRGRGRVEEALKQRCLDPSRAYFVASDHPLYKWPVLLALPSSLCSRRWVTDEPESRMPMALALNVQSAV